MSHRDDARDRAFRAMEWAHLNGDDLAGVLRLDADDDAETISIVNDALLAAGDAYYLFAHLNASRAREEAERERAERAETALAELYRRDAILVALVCDKLADQSGKLLGRIRDRVNLSAREPGKAS